MVSSDPSSTPPPAPLANAEAPAPAELVPYSNYAVAAPGAGAPGRSFGDPRRFLTFLIRRWWVILLFELLFAGLGAAYFLWWPRSYAASAHVWVAGRMGLQFHEGMSVSEDMLTFTGTQVELFQSGLILNRAYTRVLGEHIQFATNSEGEVELPTVRASQLPKSAVIELRAKGPTPQSTVAFLKAVIEEFLAYKKDVRRQSSGDTYASVSEQTLKQERELQAEQDKLTTYMKANNVGVLQNEAIADSSYLSTLLAEASGLKLQYDVLEALSGEGPSAIGSATNTADNAPDLGRIAQIITPNAAPPMALQEAQQELQKLKTLRARLSKYLRPEHPKIVKIDEQIAQARELAEFMTKQSREQVVKMKQTTKLKLDRVEQTITNYEAKINDHSERIAEFERQKQRVTVLQESRKQMESLLQQVDVTKNLDHENINVLDIPNKAKDARRAPVVVAFLLVMGLGVGLGFVFLNAQLDDRILSPYDLRGRFEEWLVGRVPEVPRQRKSKVPALLAVDDERHTFLESHRAIRSALWFAMPQAERPKVILVTSAVPQEGKSTIAANLARTMAFAGARVLLIDADLRRGHLHEMFDRPAEPGLGDLLAREGDLPFYLTPTSIPNLTLLPCGKAPANSGELFLGPISDRLLARARKEFDCVIIDSMPVFAADDTTSLAPKADGVLFVVRNGFTSSESARQALAMLYERRAKVLGLILNRTATDSRSQSYYNYRAYARRQSPGT